MKRKLLLKALWRNIWATKGRMIAIILIIMLGTLMFVGIKSVGPDMHQSANQLYKQQKSADLTITSTTGFTNHDLKLARSIKGAHVQASKTLFSLDKQDSNVVQALSYSSTNKLDRPKLKSGHLPRHNNEIVLDQVAEQHGFKIGQTYRLKTGQLTRKSYRIVGFVSSPQFIDNQTRGNANIGNGQVDYFAYIPQSNFKQTVYSTIGIKFNNLTNYSIFSANYKHTLKRDHKLLKKAFSGRATQRTQQLINTAKQKYSAMGVSLSTSQLTSLTAKSHTSYSITNIKERPGVSGYFELTDRITSIANVFPLFFFLVAALITFTTMTRMVEEDRLQIGTLKALGYHRNEIATNYLLYALIAAILGSLLGVVIGTKTLPQVVYNAMHQYIFTARPLLYSQSAITLATIFSFLATFIAVLIALLAELRAKPATLLLPKTPKNGQRILLERFTLLWRHLSFNAKVSYRNLFRFKSRMWMVIIGIAGGTALILTGFGLRDSIGAASTQQFGNITNYQAIMMASHAKQDKIDEVLQANKYFHSATPVNTETVTVSKGSTQVAQVTQLATSKSSSIKKYIKLESSQSNQKLTLSDNGIILTKKAAQKLNVTAGDRIKIKTATNQSYSVKISAIANNYTGNFVYMNATQFKQATGDRYQANAQLLKLSSHLSSTQEHKLAKQLIAHGAENVTYISAQKKIIDREASTLDPIVFIFIILSALLSFVVLYNLTNINISERIRELSTIKVLGFFNREVTLYVARENIVLTIVGILLGYGLGNLLTEFILQKAASDAVIFPLVIHWGGYAIAAILTIIFTIIVTIFTHFKLTKIDMVDALKSNE